MPSRRFAISPPPLTIGVPHVPIPPIASSITPPTPIHTNHLLSGIISDQLSALLQLILPAATKSQRILLGVGERTLASSIAQQLGINCDTGERTLEFVRGIRLHAEKLLAKAGTGMTSGDVKMAQLGLGHSYSRGKVKVSTLGTGALAPG